MNAATTAAPARYLVEVCVGGEWLPLLDSNDADGNAVATVHASREAAEELAADTRRDPEFADADLRVVEVSRGL